MASYSLVYTDSSGNKLAELDPLSFGYVLVYGDVGWATVVLPYRANALYTNENVDYQIRIFRDGVREGIFFCRRWSFNTSGGFTQVQLSAADPNYLLSSRIVAQYAGTDEAEMSDNADDMMKAVVRDAFTDGTDYAGSATGRDISGLGFSVAGDTSDGPSINRAFAWTNVLSVLKGIQAASKAEGTEVFFDLKEAGGNGFIFTTYTGQPGANRALNGGVTPLIFAPEWGNMAAPFYSEDYSDEENYIYGGGQGQGTSRNIQEVSDSGLIGASIWNRREGFAQANSAQTDNAVREAARDRLAKQRPEKVLRGTLLSTQETPYGGGDGWRVGDKVTTRYLGIQRSAIIRSVSVSVDENGAENISARVESVS